MSDGITWKDQWHSHRAQAVIFDTRRKFYAAQSRRDKADKLFLDANRHRELSQEYRNKAIAERSRAAEIKSLFLSPTATKE